MVDLFLKEFSKMNLNYIFQLIENQHIEYEYYSKKQTKVKLKRVFDTFHYNKNTELINYEIKCNLCNAKLIAFVGNKSPHYIICKIEEKHDKVLISNCVNEFPDFNLNGLKLMRAYELMIGIKQPEPDLSPDLFGEQESVKEFKEWLAIKSLPDITDSLLKERVTALK